MLAMKAEDDDTVRQPITRHALPENRLTLNREQRYAHCPKLALDTRCARTSDNERVREIVQAEWQDEWQELGGQELSVDGDCHDGQRLVVEEVDRTVDVQLITNLRIRDIEERGYQTVWHARATRLDSTKIDTRGAIHDLLGHFLEDYRQAYDAGGRPGTCYGLLHMRGALLTQLQNHFGERLRDLTNSALEDLIWNYDKFPYHQVISAEQFHRQFVWGSRGTIHPPLPCH